MRVFHPPQATGTKASVRLTLTRALEINLRTGPEASLPKHVAVNGKAVAVGDVKVAPWCVGVTCAFLGEVVWSEWWWEPSGSAPRCLSEGGAGVAEPDIGIFMKPECFYRVSCAPRGSHS